MVFVARLHINVRVAHTCGVENGLIRSGGTRKTYFQIKQARFLLGLIFLVDVTNMKHALGLFEM